MILNRDLASFVDPGGFHYWNYLLSSVSRVRSEAAQAVLISRGTGQAAAPRAQACVSPRLASSRDARRRHRHAFSVFTQSESLCGSLSWFALSTLCSKLRELQFRPGCFCVPRDETSACVFRAGRWSRRGPTAISRSVSFAFAATQFASPRDAMTLRLAGSD